MNQKYQRERGATQLPTHLLLNCCTASFVQQFHWFTLHADYLSSFATTCVARNRVKLTKKHEKNELKIMLAKLYRSLTAQKCILSWILKCKKLSRRATQKLRSKLCLCVCVTMCWKMVEHKTKGQQLQLMANSLWQGRQSAYCQLVMQRLTYVYTIYSTI